MPETVYLVQAECMDYYCGCGGGHVVGVFTSREQAEEQKGTVTPVVLDEARRGENLAPSSFGPRYDIGPSPGRYGWT